MLVLFVILCNDNLPLFARSCLLIYQQADWNKLLDNRLIMPQKPISLCYRPLNCYSAQTYKTGYVNAMVGVK